MRRIYLPVLMLLLAGCAACPQQTTVNPPALTVEVKIAQGLNVVSQACSDILKLIQEIMPAQSEDRRQIVATVQVIVKANVAARKTLEAVSKSPAATPAEVVAAMRPALLTLNQALSDGLLGIKNPESQRQARIWFLSVVTGLSVLQAVLEVQS